MDLVSNDPNLDNLYDSYYIEENNLLDVSFERFKYEVVRYFDIKQYCFTFKRKNYSIDDVKLKHYLISLDKKIYRCDSCNRENCYRKYCDGRNQEEEKCILYNKNLTTDFLDSLLKYNLLCIFLENNIRLSDDHIIDYYEKISNNNYIFLNNYLEKHLINDVLTLIFDFL